MEKAYGHVKSSFDTPTQKFRTKVWKDLAIYLEKMKKDILIKKEVCLSNCSHGHVKCSFDNPADEYRQKAENF